jgi:replicative DNA helicase
MYEPEDTYDEQTELEIRLNDPLRSVDAERSTLGAMMLSRAAWEEVLETLEPWHFSLPAHQVIYQAMPQSVGSDGWVDFVVLVNALGPKLKDAGGEDYLQQLADDCPSPANALTYAKVVLDCWWRRKILDECRAIALDCRNPDLSANHVRERASVLTDLPRPSNGAWKPIRDIQVRPMSETGVSTGFPQLDAAIDTRGYPSGQMTIVAAVEKGGKSTFMLSSFIELSQNCTERVGYASFADLNAEQLRIRINRAMTGFRSRPTHEPDASEYDATMADIGFWSSGVYDASEHDDGACIETFAAWLKAEHKKAPFAAFFLDYAQEIQTVRDTQGNEARQNAITSQAVNRLASKLKIPIIVGSQLSGIKDGQPMTKWGRVWMAKCGWMIWVQHDDETHACDVVVLLSRFGGQKGKIPMTWDRRNLRIR